LRASSALMRTILKHRARFDAPLWPVVLRDLFARE
jgi:hypothetical protein